MKQFRISAVAALWGLAAVGCAVALAETSDSGGGRPKLAVLIVVDQLRGDLVERYAEDFGEGGFKRFFDDGAHYTNAHFSHGVTKTAPGHATVATGKNPNAHGIASNEWMAPDLGRYIYGVDDDSAEQVGGEPDHRRYGRSPQYLSAPTLGDMLRAQTDDEAMVYSMSLKDRAAILMGGKNADLALWYDSGDGAFVTSTHYAQALPNWVQAFNDMHPAAKYCGESWTRVDKTKSFDTARVDDAPYERGGSLGSAFPHPMVCKDGKADRSYYRAVSATPFGNDLLVSLARAALEANPLGQDDVPDLLCIGFSSNDNCGHIFGPESAEVHDMTVRTDRQLAELFALLDEKVGKGRWIAALTGDHGVAAMPEYAQERGWGGGRYESKQAAAVAADALRKAFDIEDSELKLTKLLPPWLYLNERVLAERGIDVEKAAAVAADALKEQEYVERLVPLAEIRAEGDAGSDALLAQVRQSYVPGRSGQVYLHTKPFWITGKNAATHGSAHEYDRSVPILLYGPGVEKGTFPTAADPIAIVPMMSALLKVAPPERLHAAPVRPAASHAEAEKAKATPGKQSKLDRAEDWYKDYVKASDGREYDRLLKFVADDAKVHATVRRESGDPFELNWTGKEYKQVSKMLIPMAKARGDRDVFSNPTFRLEGDRVRITATRYSVRKKFASPATWLVGPDTDGEWRAFEVSFEGRR